MRLDFVKTVNVRFEMVLIVCIIFFPPPIYWISIDSSNSTTQHIILVVNQKICEQRQDFICQTLVYLEILISTFFVSLTAFSATPIALTALATLPLRLLPEYRTHIYLPQLINSRSIHKGAAYPPPINPNGFKKETPSQQPIKSPHNLRHI